MTYDKYTEMQESMHGKEAMYGIFTENEEQLAGRSRSVNDPSDGSKDVHISISGLTNSTKANPLLSATSQSNTHGNNNETKIQNEAQLTPISPEIEESISQHLKACKKNVFVKKLPNNLVLGQESSNVDEAGYGFSDSSSDDSEDVWEDEMSTHVMRALQLAKTTKIASLVSDAVHQREVVLDTKE